MYPLPLGAVESSPGNTSPSPKYWCAAPSSAVPASAPEISSQAPRAPSPECRSTTATWLALPQWLRNSARQSPFDHACARPP